MDQIGAWIGAGLLVGAVLVAIAVVAVLLLAGCGEGVDGTRNRPLSEPAPPGTPAPAASPRTEHRGAPEPCDASVRSACSLGLLLLSLERP